MLSRKGSMKDFLTENLTYLIILVVVLALLIILYFSGVLGSGKISETLSGFGKSLVTSLGGRR